MLNWLERMLAVNPSRTAAQLRRPSGWLSHIVGRKMNESNASMYDFLLRSVDFTTASTALEIGFGNGKLFDRVLRAAPQIRLRGLDYSTDMVRQARRNMRAAVRAGHLILEAGSSDRMPYPDGSFDIVYCINVVYFWDQPAAHLREIRRVLRPGGRFAAVLRTRSSMQHLPFVQQGFTMYEASEWQAEVQAHGFARSQVNVLQEPPVQFAGQSLHPTSLCVVNAVSG